MFEQYFEKLLPNNPDFSDLKPALEPVTESFEKNVQDGLLKIGNQIKHKLRHLDFGSDFESDLPKMYELFNKINPKDKLSTECGVTNKPFMAFLASFPKYHRDILHLTARSFTFIRLERINFEFKNQKKNDKPLNTKTLRSATNVNRFMF